jgi:uncharacterized protein with PIN domain
MKGSTIIYKFDDAPSVKHAIETMGIPHPEVRKILVKGTPVDFHYRLQNKDAVEIFPFSPDSVQIDSFRLLADEQKFILDVHLGKLAKALRLFGFDSLFENDYSDHAIVQIAEKEKRTVLTRDRNLLKRKLVKSGYWLRSQFPEEQLTEVIKRFALNNKFRFFQRCSECNGKIVPVKKQDVLHLLLPKTILYYRDLFQCTNCRRIYWRGSHYRQIENFILLIQVKLGI